MHALLIYLVASMIFGFASIAIKVDYVVNIVNKDGWIAALIFVACVLVVGLTLTLFVMAKEMIIRLGGGKRDE